MPKGRPKKLGDTPSNFSWKLADHICEQISGGKTLTQLMKEYKGKRGYPTHINTIFRWRRDIPKFAEMYEMAIETRSEAHVEQLLDLADELKAGTLTLREAQFKAEQIKWTAPRLNKKYREQKDARDDTPQQVMLVMDFGAGAKQVEKIKMQELEDAREAELEEAAGG